MSDSIVEANETPDAVGEKLASYSHTRTVKAGKILDLDLPRGHATVELSDGSHEIIDVTYPAGENPQVGDYFVVDGETEDTVPAATFEAQYTKAP